MMGGYVTFCKGTIRDLLPHDLVQAVLDGLHDGAQGDKPDPSVWAAVREAAVGPYRLEYADKTVALTRKGIQMGLPTTWGLLCLVHLFWVAVADATERNGASSRSSISLSGLSVKAKSGQVRICGDDLIGVVSRPFATAYERIAELCGAKFSARKHFHSRTIGFFTEEAYRFRRDRVLLGKSGFPKLPSRQTLRPAACRSPASQAVSSSSCSKGAGVALGVRPPWTSGKFNRSVSVILHKARPMEVIPLRWAAGPSRWQVRSGFATRPLPVWASLGPAACAVSHLVSWRLKLVTQAWRRAWPGLASFGRSAGLLPYLPRELGGMGLPCSRLHSLKLHRVAPRWLRCSLMKWLYRSPPESAGPVGAWLHSIAPLWTRGAEFAAEKAAKLPRSRSKESVPSGVAECLGTVSDVVDLLSTSYVRLSSLGAGRSMDKRDLGVSGFRIRRALSKWCARTGSTGDCSRGYTVQKALQRASEAPAERVLWIFPENHRKLRRKFVVNRPGPPSGAAPGPGFAISNRIRPG